MRRKQEAGNGRNRGQVAGGGEEGDERNRKGSGKSRKRSESGKEGKHLRNSCGKRIREGQKETNRKPSTRTWKEGMRDQAGEKGESEEAKAETGH